jgi:hypothetical protein
VYAFTFFPFLVVYFDTAFFFGVFFVALPSAAPARAAISGIGMPDESSGQRENFRFSVLKFSLRVGRFLMLCRTTAEVSPTGF